MSTDRYAILLDGGFVVPKLKVKLHRYPTADDVMGLCSRLGADPVLRDLKLLRIYFYNAPPYTELVQNPISKTKVPHDAKALARIAAWTSLHDKMELMPDVALRMGVTVCHGWKLTPKALKELDGTKPLKPEDMMPHIEQCVFRLMPGHSSGPCRAAIPAHAGPGFRSMPGQHSGACRAS